MPPHLLDLPVEILNGIFRECHPSDLGSISQSCKDLHLYILGNNLLIKEIYLQNFDKSRLIPDDTGTQWRHYLQRFVKLGKLLESKDIDVKRDNFEFISAAIFDFLKHANELSTYGSQNVTSLAQAFDPKEINLATLMCQSSLFARIRSEPRLRSQGSIGQLSAKLHCLHGIPVFTDPNSRETDKNIVRTYPYAISKVYDLRNYTMGTLWGPFLDDGKQRVDWEMVEAIIIVLGHNLRHSRECAILCRNVWTEPFSGASAQSYTSGDTPKLYKNEMRPSTTLGDNPPAEFKDPYNITGIWMRVVCFLDYRDLFEYNFARARPREEPLDPYPSQEATRLIIMQLRAVGFDEHGPEDDKNWPVVKYIGTTFPVHASWDSNAHATMKGTVRMTEEGELRWTSFSIYHGEERWRSEGIQVGGINSARGVIGTWFDKDYGHHGPAGPTAFWKISDAAEIGNDNDEEEDESSVFLNSPIIIIQS